MAAQPLTPTQIAALPADHPGEGDLDLMRAMHRAIADVTHSIESFAFNKAIAKLYEFTNTLGRTKASGAAQKLAMRTLAQLMAPMVPHLSEDIWHHQGGAGLVTLAPWPVADPAMLVDDTVTLPIQVNGKRRGEIRVARGLEPAEVEAIVMADPDVQARLEGQTVRKIVVVKDRIVNLVVG